MLHLCRAASSHYGTICLATKRLSVIIRLVTSAACRPDAAQRVHYVCTYLLIFIALLCYLHAISGGMRSASDVALTVAYVL